MIAGIAPGKLIKGFANRDEYGGGLKGAIKGIGKAVTGGDTDDKLDKIQEVKVAEQQIEVDPRSKTTADQAFNYIATGKPEMPVGGQKRMLPEKRRNSKAY